MQERVKTSFIPKASLQTERRGAPSRNPVGVVNVIATIILIAAIVAAAGMFLFEQFTIQNIERKRASLERARAAFEPATIKELSRLNTRLSVGASLLNSHVAPSRVFDELEAITLGTVRYGSFSLVEVTPGVFAISFSGEARSFNALALQSDAFGKSNVFTKPIFDGLNINDTGNVVFNFSSEVNLDQIRYQPRGADTTQTPPGEVPL